MTSSAGTDDELTRLISTLVRDVPDYPQAGVVFKDITPLLADGKAFAAVIDALAATYGPVDKVAGIEARGFILAAPVACRSEEHTSELQSRLHLVCRLLLEKKKNAVFWSKGICAIDPTYLQHYH